MRIFVIRHAETEYNQQCLLQGNIDSPLTQLGLTQAYLLSKELSPCDIDMVFSSTAQRAYDTARAIALPRRLPVVMVPDLRERAFGIYEGKGLAEAKGAHPEYFTTSQKLDMHSKPDGGESLEEVAKRVFPFLKRLEAHFQDKAIAIVSHGVVNKLIVGQLLDGSLDNIAQYKQANGCITEILIENGKAKALRLCSTEHLKGAEKQEKKQ